MFLCSLEWEFCEYKAQEKPLYLDASLVAESRTYCWTRRKALKQPGKILPPRGIIFLIENITSVVIIVVKGRRWVLHLGWRRPRTILQKCFKVTHQAENKQSARLFNFHTSACLRSSLPACLSPSLPGAGPRRQAQRDGVGCQEPYPRPEPGRESPFLPPSPLLSPVPILLEQGGGPQRWGKRLPPPSRQLGCP